MSFNLGRELKRKGITQKMFREILEEKYNHSVRLNTVNNYCSREYPSSHSCWDVVRRCLKEQFNIEHKNGRWQEVNDIG